MKRIAALFVAVLGVVSALALPAAAGAHPLGNFTINRYAGIEVAGRDLYVHYVLDVAEIPTYQLGSELRRAGYPSSLAGDLVLTLDGQRLPLRVVEHRAVERTGAGGLATLRLDVVYGAEGTGTTLGFRDATFPERIGWREVTVSAREGGRVLVSDVPVVSASAALRKYPSDRLRSPLDVSAATARIEFGSKPAAPPTIDAVETTPHVGRGLESLIEQRHLSVGVLLVSLLIAVFWGAAHALTPGHGKAMVAAYLVGTRGTARHALMLGATVTAAHTAGVFGLGFVTLALSAFVVPEQLYPWLTLASGLLVVVVGASVLRQRLRSRSPAHGEHAHHHGHEHHHHDDALTSKGIVGVGVAAGLLPCPSALVVLLSAIAVHRVGLGLALIVAFSLGLAATITAIGLVAVLARRTFGRLTLNGPLVRALPAASAGLILVVGLAITARAVPGVL